MTTAARKVIAARRTVGRWGRRAVQVGWSTSQVLEGHIRLRLVLAALLLVATPAVDHDLAIAKTKAPCKECYGARDRNLSRPSDRTEEATDREAWSPAAARWAPLLISTTSYLPFYVSLDSLKDDSTAGAVPVAACHDSATADGADPKAVPMGPASAKGRAARVAQAPESRAPGLTWSAVNPIRSTGAIRFALPSAAPVSVGIFDLQGRRIASLLERSAQPAGVHELTFSTRNWAPGVYLCRFKSGTILATKKLIVVR